MLNDGPVYSICIPAYKSRFLKDCIQSILNQHYERFELIILNDCSPEAVADIVSGFSDPRIRYFENEKNVGAERLVENWNKCLDLAEGEYSMIMGDDDLLAPEYLEEFNRLIEQYPELNVYHCRSAIINAEGKTTMLTPALPAYEQVYDSIWHRLHQLRSNYISDYVYRTEALRRQGAFYNLPLAWGSDDITAFIASQEKGIAHSNRPVFLYRSNEWSITSTGNDSKKMEAQGLYADWFDKFLQHPPANETDKIIHQHLRKNQHVYMRQRKIYTMTVSMQKQLWRKMLFWLSVRQRFGLSWKDVLAAALTSIKRRQ